MILVGFVHGLATELRLDERSKLNLIFFLNWLGNIEKEELLWLRLLSITVSSFEHAGGVHKAFVCMNVRSSVEETELEMARIVDLSLHPSQVAGGEGANVTIWQRKTGHSFTGRNLFLLLSKAPCFRLSPSFIILIFFSEAFTKVL